MNGAPMFSWTARRRARFAASLMVGSLLSLRVMGAPNASRVDPPSSTDAQVGHASDCGTVRIFARQSCAPTSLRYAQQDIEIDSISGAERELPATDYLFVCDGVRWCLRSGTALLSCDGATVREWDMRERCLTVHAVGFNPHPESMMFILTQALEFNEVIPDEEFLSACSCKDRPAHQAEVPNTATHARLGADAAWRHHIECDGGLEQYVRSWELAIPRAANANGGAVERRVRVTASESDNAGLPLKLVRVVEERCGDGTARPLGRSVLSVRERRAFDPIVEAAQFLTPALTEGWTVIDTTRNLQYVFGEPDFILAAVQFRADSPIRVPPEVLRLRELVATAQAR